MGLKYVNETVNGNKSSHGEVMDYKVRWVGFRLWFTLLVDRWGQCMRNGIHTIIFFKRLCLMSHEAQPLPRRSEALLKGSHCQDRWASQALRSLKVKYPRVFPLSLGVNFQI